MLHRMIQPSDRLAFSDFRVLFLHHMIAFLLLQSCTGQTQVIGPSQPIVATAGDDIILSCHLEPAINASDLRLEWARPDLSPGFVHVRVNSQEYVVNKQPSYRGRTSLLIDKLKDGDISLRLSEVKPSDEGTYRCLVPALGRAAFIKLIVGAASSPFIHVINRNGTNVVLQCESKGWYPEPEVFWLDGEGNFLSAGPTETVRGPDDLYTVNSRVTVEKRHNNIFTCRVQQKNINQTRETHIIVPALSSYMKCILALGLIGVVLWAAFTIHGSKQRCQSSVLNEVTTQKTDMLLQQETADTEKGPVEDELPAPAQEVAHPSLSCLDEIPNQTRTDCN